MVNTIIYNVSTDALAGAVNCDNGAEATAPNSIVNCSLVTLGAAKCIDAGAAYTILSKNNISASNAIPVSGTHLLPVNTDIIGNGTIMTFGSDAFGDMYYRTSSGQLHRIAIGANGQVLKVVSGVPTWATP